MPEDDRRAMSYFLSFNIKYLISLIFVKFKPLYYVAATAVLY